MHERGIDVPVACSLLYEQYSRRNEHIVCALQGADKLTDNGRAYKVVPSDAAAIFWPDVKRIEHGRAMDILVCVEFIQEEEQTGHSMHRG